MDTSFRTYLIAKMYYIDNINQSDIAKLLETSKMNISRALKRAEKEGIVAIQVKAPDRVNWVVSSQLKRKFPKMKEIIAIDVQPGDNSRTAIGEAAVDYFKDLLTDNCVVGLSWGRTLLEFAKAIKLEEKYKGLTVLQMSGSFLCEDDADMMPSNLVKVASEYLKSRPIFLNAPLIVSSKQIKDSLMQDEMIRYVYMLGKEMDIALYGLSKLGTPATMFSVGAISEADIEELKGKGAIGDVLGYFLDAQGNQVTWSKSDCYMGIPLESACAAKHAILLATGREKKIITRVAIEHNYCNTLIISMDLGQALLEQ